MTTQKSSQRPLLLLDVDGVLSPFDKNGEIPEGFKMAETDVPYYLCLNKIHKIWIEELAEVFDIVWATTWENMSNSVVGKALGVREFPIMPLNHKKIHSVNKFWSIEDYVEKRPCVWIDNSIWQFERDWAKGRHVKTLLIKTDPYVGLIREHVDKALVFAKSLQVIEKLQ
jgi:hypothetical protein